jgi:hypothetical protein
VRRERHVFSFRHFDGSGDIKRRRAFHTVGRFRSRLKMIRWMLKVINNETKIEKKEKKTSMLDSIRWWCDDEMSVFPSARARAKFQIGKNKNSRAKKEKSFW